MKLKSESEVAQSCPTLSDRMDCSLPGSSVHGFSRQEYWSGVPLPSPDLSAPTTNTNHWQYLEADFHKEAQWAIFGVLMGFITLEEALCC